MPGTGPNVRIAIIDNSIHPEIYRPVAHWSRYLPAAWDAFIAREHRFPGLSGYTHLILTGSEASILERESWVDEEAELAAEAVHRGLAVLGSCWGHQLLAFALAGPGHVRSCARPEIGWIPISVDRGGDLLGPAGEAQAFSVHFDEVFNLPPEFEVLASTGLCPVQAFRLSHRPVWGIQSHPEVDPETGLRFLRDLLGAGFKGRPFLRQALGSEPKDSGLIHRIVPAFLGE